MTSLKLRIGHFPDETGAAIIGAAAPTGQGSAVTRNDRQHTLNPQQQPGTVKLLAAFAAVWFIWGSTYLFISFAIETVPPFLMAAIRFGVAGSLLYAWVRLKDGARPTWENWRAGIITGALFFLCGNGAVVWAQQRVPSGIAALLVAIVPLFVVLLQWLPPYHKRPTLVVMMGVIVGLLGLVLLVGPGAFTGTSEIDILAAAVLTFGSLCWAFGTLYSGRAPLPKNALLTAALQLLSGAVLLALLGFVAGEHTRIDASTISLKSVLSIAYLMFFGSIVAFTAYSWLTRVASPARLSTYAYVNPVVALILGWLFAGEKLSKSVLMASAVILAGVVLITLGSARKKARQPTR